MDLFERMGREPGVARLVDAFYDHMAEAPDMAPLLALHPDLERARERLYEFLVGWMGGPPLFVQKYGHPRLRMRHLHVAIDETGVALWMRCMDHALMTTVPHEDLRELLHSNFSRLAAHMQNVFDEASESP
ncbi:MAG: group II truncated hemoglobin [Myxococcota bacterium]